MPQLWHQGENLARCVHGCLQGRKWGKLSCLCSRSISSSMHPGMSVTATPQCSFCLRKALSEHPCIPQVPCCCLFFFPDASRVLLQPGLSSSQVSPPPPACGLLCVSGAGVGRACQQGGGSSPPLSLTVCAAGGGRAGGRPSGSRNSCRAWPPSGYGGAEPGRRCWRSSWSSAGTCGAWWSPCAS